MSNIMNVPDHIASRIKARQDTGKTSSVADAIVGSGEGQSFPRISIRAGRFRLCESGVETVVGTNLDVIIVGANPRVSKVFYAQAFDQNGENVRPACFSNDGIKAHESVDAPVSSNCAGCPHNELGSKILPSGARSKMCADQRHLAVVAAADPNKVFALTVPVSAMKSMREYFKELVNYGLAPEEVVTELGFDEQASFPKLVFSHKGFVNPKGIQHIDTIADSDATKIATRQLDVSSSVKLPPAETKAKLEAPVVDDAYEDEAAPAAAPAKKERPKVEPIQQSDQLANDIADLFDEE